MLAAAGWPIAELWDDGIATANGRASTHEYTIDYVWCEKSG